LAKLFDSTLPPVNDLVSKGNARFFDAKNYIGQQYKQYSGSRRRSIKITGPRKKV